MQLFAWMQHPAAPELNTSSQQSSLELQEQITGYVHHGGAYLDAYVEKWWEKVDLSTLEMSSSKFDILAQLFGTYPQGLNALALEDEEIVKYGFDIKSNIYMEYNEDQPSIDQQYELYTQAWQYEVKMRLG